MIILMRGWPGCGKSYSAQHDIVPFLSKKNPCGVNIYSTDHYFMKDGKYIYVPSQIADAHAWNVGRCRKHLEHELTSDIVVDNTNILIDHMRPYVELAAEYNQDVYQYIPLDCSHVLDAWWSEKSLWDNKTSAMLTLMRDYRRNVHGVPLHVLVKMLESFETSDLRVFDFS